MDIGDSRISRFLGALTFDYRSMPIIKEFVQSHSKAPDAAGAFQLLSAAVALRIQTPVIELEASAGVRP